MADEMNTPPGASLSDIGVILNQIARGQSLLIQTMSSILPRVSGTFTLSGGSVTTVTQPAVTASSVINWNLPTNASAATIMGSAKCLYLSAKTAGSNFVLTTANAGTTAGTETFQYWLWNPV